MQCSMNCVQRSLEAQPVKDIQIAACEGAKTVLSDTVCSSYCLNCRLDLSLNPPVVLDNSVYRSARV